ncbi:M43 family zinc metalloprotease [Flaviaesturariibacter terrae]
MKKFTRYFLGLCVLVASTAAAQTSRTDFPKSPQTRSCGTEVVLQRQLQDPAYRAAYEAHQREAAPARTSTLTAPVTIPVVVHVVLPNPFIITEAQVDALIAQLNLDFGGTNADSTNGVNFYAKRGHSKIRFTRARRTPTGGFTTGLERRAGELEILTQTFQPIKHANYGGLDPWDVTKYYNIWVGSSATLLGISPAIGPGNATETTASQVGIDGVCIEYSVFSTGCFSNSSFNKGRTAVHEIGHNFGLYHIFQGCAAGNDFAQLSLGTGTLPSNLYGSAADDTPGQTNETSGCPTGAQSSTGCTLAQAPNPPGKMYQNFMDYTNDACYSMFTTNQVARMEYVLENLRPGYLTTDGATAPVGTPNLDVAPARLINPGGILFDNTACSASGFSIPVCPGAMTPRVEIVNRGNSTITSLTVSVQLNSNTPVSTTFNGLNIAYGNTATLTLPSITTVAGTNVIKVTTSSPNGGVDGAAANDVISTTINLGTVTAPLTENFEGASFPSANFNINNLHGDTTWRKVNVGAGGSGSSAFIDNYDNANTGSTDDIRLVPTALTAGADSLVVSFDVAHQNYVDATTGDEYSDTLNVLVSNNCGTSYTNIYQNAGANLATAGPSTTAFTNPTAAQWRRERVAVAGALASGTVEVILQNKTSYGNNIFVDNINVSSTCRTTTITTQPAATQAVCAGSPVTFSVAATGNASLSYQWYKGSSPIASATGATYTIASASATDAATYYVVVKNACNVTTQSGNSVLTVNTGGACGGTAVSNINTDVQSIVLMPNAIRNTSTLRVYVARAMKIEWKVIDANGRIVKRFTQQAVAGQNTLGFDANALATGAYQLVGDTNKGKTTTLKFVRL